MKTNYSRSSNTTIGMLSLALAGMVTYQAVQAQRQPPSEHQGVSVTSLGVVDQASMSAQIGLEGYKMQLREIVLQPGGQIARHDHAGRPGLVWTLSGSWIEGRPEGEKAYPAGLDQAIVEDEATDHWFWNDGDEPARVVVCDIVPDK